MNLHQRGAELMNQLKEHVLDTLEEHPDAEKGGAGVIQEEIARRAGLHSKGTVELDHTCGEILSLLHKEGKVECVDVQEEDSKKKRWRFT